MVLAVSLNERMVTETVWCIEKKCEAEVTFQMRGRFTPTRERVVRCSARDGNGLTCRLGCLSQFKLKETVLP